MLVESAEPSRDTREHTEQTRSSEISAVVPSKTLQLFQSAVRFLLAVIMIWAGLSKFGDPVSFYTTLLEYRLPIPGGFLRLVAVILPWLELLCGLMLLANVYRRASLLWAAVLFSVFLVMVGQAFLRGLDISCGCFDLTIFGIAESSDTGRFLESTEFALVRNSVLLVGALYLFRQSVRPRSDSVVP